MALEQRLQLKLSQKLVMTPSLQQAIKLLQLSRLELEQALSQELEVNPLLEMSEEAQAEEAPLAPSEGGITTQEDVAGNDDGLEPGSAASFNEVEIEALFSNYLHDSPTLAPTWEDDENGSRETAREGEASLYEQLIEQLHLREVPLDLLPLAEFVIGNLDPDGYLRTDAADLAAQLNVAADRIAAAIEVVQSLDPPGIGARSLRECFLLQIERLPDRDGPVLALAERLLHSAFDDFLHQRWDRIQRALGVDVEQIRAVIEVLRRLDVHPGARLGPIEATPVEPDIVVTKEDGRWKVVQNDDGMPRLRLSSRYVRLLQNRTLDRDASGFLRERMRAALWFLRSVEQRRTTILKVAEAIVRRQERFFDDGVVGLKPLVLRDIADDIGMHESTVSRVVTNKYMSTPRGVLPLKFFFHSAISHAVQGDISSVAVKERIRDLIDAEDADKPLSDAKIARQLNRIGIRIARRTVAKYREELAIPSSEQRRKVLR